MTEIELKIFICKYFKQYEENRDTSFGRYKNDYSHTFFDFQKTIYYQKFKRTDTIKHIKEQISIKLKIPYESIKYIGNFIRTENRNEISWIIYGYVNYSDNTQLVNTCFIDNQVIYVEIDTENNFFKTLDTMGKVVEKERKENKEKIERLETESNETKHELNRTNTELDIFKKKNLKLEEEQRLNKEEIKSTRNQLNEEQKKFKNLQKEFIYTKKIADDSKTKTNALAKELTQLKEEKIKIENNNKEAEIELNNKKNIFLNEQIQLIKTEFLIKIPIFFLKEKIDNKGHKIPNFLTTLLIDKRHKDFNVPKLSDDIFNLIQTKFTEFSKEKIDIQLSKYNIQRNSEINHLNILIMGKAGAGKSTLINVLLNLKNEFKAKAQIGKSQTLNIKRYPPDNIESSIRIYDTPGIDFKKSIEILGIEIKNLVEEKINTNNPDEFIHCIWYCTSGTRFQIEESNFIAQLTKLYSGDKLPVIIVQLQQASRIQAKKFENEMRNTLCETLGNDEGIKIPLLDVYSQPLYDKDEKTNKIKILVESRGIPQLIEKTKEMMKQSLSSATYESIKRNIQKQCEQYKNKLQENIFEVLNSDLKLCEVNELLEEKKQTENEDNIYFDDEDKNQDITIQNNINLNFTKYEPDYFIKNFSSELTQKLMSLYYLISNIHYSNNIRDNIKKNLEIKVNKLKESLLKYYGKFFDKKFLEKKVETLNNRLEKIIKEIDWKKKSNLSHYERNFGNEIMNLLKKNFFELGKNEFLKYSLGCFFKLFLQDFNKKLDDLNNSILHSQEINQLINYKTKQSMENGIEKIMKKIKYEPPENIEKNNVKNEKEKQNESKDKEKKNEDDDVNYEDLLSDSENND